MPTIEDDLLSACEMVKGWTQMVRFSAEDTGIMEQYLTYLGDRVDGFRRIRSLYRQLAANEDINYRFLLRVFRVGWRFTVGLS